MGNIETEIKKYPVHLIARMATHERYQNNGIGSKMLTWAHAITFHLCKYTGCRFIKVDAKNNEKTVNFYHIKGGFTEISRNNNTVQMILDINKTPELPKSQMGFHPDHK
jgi:GNAT superfamily N-acetyltransferase